MVFPVWVVWTVVFITSCFILYTALMSLVKSKVDEQVAHNAARKDILLPGLNVSPGKDQEIELISSQPDEALIIKTVREFDWSDISFVILVFDEDHWVDVSGSIDPSDGLSSKYYNNGMQMLASPPPENIDEMVNILLDFYGDRKEALRKYNFV